MLDDFKHMKQKVNQSYFDKLPSEIMDKLSDVDMIDIEQDAPMLHRIGKKEGFQVPEQYFENFTVELPSSKPVIKLWSSSYSVLGIAAGLILLAASLFLLNQNETTQEVEMASLDQLEDEFLLDEILDSDELTVDELFESMSGFDEDLEEVDINTLIETNLDDFDLTELEQLL
jgi:hypothetical protein